MLALAMGVVGTESGSPRSTLYRTVRSYHRALHEGRLEEAARLADAGDPSRVFEQRRRGGTWLRRSWLVQNLAIREDGRVGEVVVAAIDPDRGFLAREAEIWERAEGSHWRLVDWEPARTRGPGR
jgi:hypothetical protein